MQRLAGTDARTAAMTIMRHSCLHMYVDLAVQEIVQVVRCCGPANPGADDGNTGLVPVLQLLLAEQRGCVLLARNPLCRGIAQRTEHQYEPEQPCRTPDAVWPPGGVQWRLSAAARQAHSGKQGSKDGCCMHCRGGAGKR